jgi:hypothetical protein
MFPIKSKSLDGKILIWQKKTLKDKIFENDEVSFV